MDKIAVLIPCYNEEKTISKVVSDVKKFLPEAVTYVYDNNSTDRTVELATEAGAIIRHEYAQGKGNVIRRMFREIDAECYLMIDGDDTYPLDCAREMVAKVLEHQADMVLSGMRYLSADGRKNTGEQYAFFNTEVFSGEEGVKKLLLGTAGALPWEREDSRYGFSACKNLYRMSCIRESGIIFPSERKVISEDVAFLLDFIPHIRKAVGIPGTFYNYCANRDSLSKSYRPDRFQKTKFLMQEMNLRLSRFFPEEEHRLYLDRQFQAYTRVICMQEIVHARKAGFDGCVLRQRLLDISRDPELQAVLRRYPWYRLPKKQAAFAFAMRYRLIWLQRLLVELRLKK